MRVELVTIKGVEYEINFDAMKIRIFDRKDELHVRRYLVQNHEEKDKFDLPEKYNRIYNRLKNIEKNKKKRPRGPKNDKLKNNRKDK